MNLTPMTFLSKIEPEIIIEKPHPSNGFKWHWLICQPDANWGVLYEGSTETYEECRLKANFYLNLSLAEAEINH